MSDVITGQTVIQHLERWSPKQFAFDWDNVGLQVGTLNKPVKNVMITLDVTERVVDEAIEKGAELIIAHHPLLFIKLKNINFDTPKGRVIRKLIQNDISVYAAHTNLDVASGGVNDVMAEAIGVHHTVPLIPHMKDDLIKVAVFVPENHVEEVRNAIGNAGGGHIGNYSHCTFQVSGEGTFKPLDGSDPFLGKQGELELADEKRMETIVQKSKLSRVLAAMEKAHPYEEVAYDLYPLINEGQPLGAGRIGELKNKVTLKELCELVKDKYDVPFLRYTGSPEKTVKKVAILGGSGEKYIHQAKQSGADVYITGDMSFHLAQDAEEMGLAVIDPGHHVEKLISPRVKQFLEQKESSLNVFVSEVDTEPFSFL